MLGEVAEVVTVTMDLTPRPIWSPLFSFGTVSFPEERPALRRSFWYITEDWPLLRCLKSGYMVRHGMWPDG